MDYTNLVAAIKENDSREVDKFMKALRPRLMAFLRIHMNADRTEAEDCAQETLLTSIEVIKSDRVNDPAQVVTYILSICRNTYLKMQKKQREQSMETVSEPQQRAPQQLQSLLNDEQEKLLSWCLDQLKQKHQQFMQYWFDHPDMQTKKVAAHFGISVNNAWTRKHRLINKLNECYRKKSKL